MEIQDFGVAVRPSAEEWCARAADAARLVPVWCEVSADSLTPVSAYRLLADDGDGFLLESVEQAERWSRFSFIGRRPLARVVAAGGTIEVQGDAGVRAVAEAAAPGGVLATLEALLAAFRSEPGAELPPLHSGVVGYIGYDVVREVERIGTPPPDTLGMPDAVLELIGELAAFDHWRQRIVLVVNVVIDPSWDAAGLGRAYQRACARLGELVEALARPAAADLAPAPAEPPAVHVERTMTTAQYVTAVGAAKDYIRAGDAFQIVLAQRYDFPLEADPFTCYRVLRQLNPSPYLYFLRYPELTVIGSSPEPMVQLRDNVVTSRPIAGTRRRGTTEDEDRKLGAELVEDPKERAEHVMLVDLARNDVGRVVRYGTEVIDELMVLERYSHVMHLTSQVSGELAGGNSAVDVLRATLPAGTVSGAPKVRAMQIIDELEVTRRGLYAGVVGYFDLSGNLDTAIAIRTMVVLPDGRASVQAGAGIVADSDPEAEDAECRHKAAALLSAVAGARALGR